MGSIIISTCPPSFFFSWSPLQSSASQLARKQYQQHNNKKQQQTTTTQQPSTKGSHTWRGETFLLSWREDETSFTWDEAKKYCSMKGMMMVSLDNPAKREHLLQVVADDGAPYFWAGGKVSLDKTLLRWVNGMVEEIVRGDHPWSHAGTRGAQPDGQRAEHCLAVLNNFYNDGVKYHDVGCKHRKPTIC